LYTNVKVSKTTTKTPPACIPDFKLLVALSAPRNAFLAEKQPPGASKSLQGSKFEKNKTHTPPPNVVHHVEGDAGKCMEFWNYSKKWFTRLSLLK
jgi:hypothetical protein